MAGTNDFLTFAAAPGANVISQATYAALAALGPGFTAGIANSNQLNKVWRQSSIMSSVLAQFMADISGQNSTDDGTTANLLTNLMTSLTAANYGVNVGSGNTYQVTLTPATQVLDGTVIRFRAVNTNTGASTFSVNGSPSHAIYGMDQNSLTGGEINGAGTAVVIWNSAASVWILLGCSAGYGKSVTPGGADNSTKIATTAFVQGLIPGSSVGGTGYIKFGNGLIIQWGRVTNSTGSTAVSYPITFPSAVFAVVLAPSFTGEIAYNFLSSGTTSGFTANSRDSSSSNVASVQDWCAFGH
jgi:hypothetical protein